VRELNFPYRLRTLILIIAVYFHPGTTFGREFKNERKKGENFLHVLYKVGQK
jgi:hypothetical protein